MHDSAGVAIGHDITHPKPNCVKLAEMVTHTDQSKAEIYGIHACEMVKMPSQSNDPELSAAC